MMKNLQTPIRQVLLLALLLVAWPLQAADSALRFDGAWIRALPPGMQMTAAFGTLRNTGPETIELTGFSSPRFGQVSLHRTEVVDGMSRMRAVPSLAIGPGDKVELSPGGYHLMLMMPRGVVAVGDTVTLEAVSGDGRKFRFEAPVRRR